MLESSYWGRSKIKFIQNFLFSALQIIINISRNFLLVDSTSVWIYTYTGRLHLNPRYPGSQAQIGHLVHSHVSMSQDTLVVRDHADQTGNFILMLPGPPVTS